jgi:bleomycin hydrolase
MAGPLGNIWDTKIIKPNIMKINVVLISLLILAKSTFIKAQIIVYDEIKIPCTSVKYQGWTGTCWCYAATSFLESELIRMSKGEFDLSEIFFVRKTYLDKSRNYVLRHGNGPFSQGALAYDALSNVKNYGAMPEEAYSIIRSDADSIDHTEMANGIRGFLDAVIETGYPGIYWLDAVDGILDAYLGEVPDSFMYKNTKYTPLSFAKELAINIDEYINITSFTHHPFYDYFILELPDNFSNGKSFNIPLEELIMTINHALEHGYSIVWNGEMSHKRFLNIGGWDIPNGRWDGLLIEETDKNLVSQENRQKSFLSYQTQDDHAMHIVGRAKDQNGNIFYLIKDSYFGRKGPYKGFIYMSEDYLKMKTLSITLNKKGLPDFIINKL